MLPQTHLALSLLLSCKKHAIFFGFFLVFCGIPESIKFSVKSAKVWEICFCLSGSRSLSQHRLKKWGAQTRRKQTTTNHQRVHALTQYHRKHGYYFRTLMVGGYEVITFARRLLSQYQLAGSHHTRLSHTFPPATRFGQKSISNSPARGELNGLLAASEVEF